MTLVLGIVAVGFLILNVVYLADLFKTMRRDRLRKRAPVVPAQPVRPITPQTQDLLMELVAQGKTMQAIKDLRAASGLGLKQAKDAVDAMAAGHDISGLLLPHSEVPATTEERARTLIAQGRTIQAVKLIREETGLGLKEAKDVADGLK